MHTGNFCLWCKQLFNKIIAQASLWWMSLSNMEEQQVCAFSIYYETIRDKGTAREKTNKHTFTAAGLRVKTDYSK